MTELDETSAVELVAQLMRGEGSEQEHDEWIATLSRCFPDPNWLDLVYYAELEPSEVVATAMAYSPIQLPK